MTTNKLYFGDNLQIMREYIPDESVDLIYLDPPFNSKRDYNILYREPDGANSQAQIQAFEDSWLWNDTSEKVYDELMNSPGKLNDLLISFRSFLGDNDTMAYLTMMAIRLIELKRVLKNTGSIYLHCDPTASHYLKILMDAIFLPKNFRNEIIWHYRRWTGAANYFLRMHDVILFYTKTENYVFNPLYTEYTKKSLLRKQHYHTRIKGDDIYVTKVNEEGVKDNDVWSIPVINSQAKERLGYPTQKPLELLRKIISASSIENNIVLDPFCGCGTTVDASIELNRNWIGIDITYLAINLIKKRIYHKYGKGISYKEIGVPYDLESAKALALKNRTQFQIWAASKVGAQSLTDEMKKGADGGIDGQIYFLDNPYKKEYKKIILQIKSGHVQVKDIRELIQVVDKNRAVIGVFITLEEPTREMKKEAIAAGFWNNDYNQKQHSKIQILTIEDIFQGKLIDYFDYGNISFKKAKRTITESEKGEQGELL